MNIGNRKKNADVMNFRFFGVYNLLNNQEFSITFLLCYKITNLDFYDIRLIKNSLAYSNCKKLLPNNFKKKYLTDEIIKELYDFSKLLNKERKERDELNFQKSVKSTKNEKRISNR
jgi:hypothetical protein